MSPLDTDPVFQILGGGKTFCNKTFKAKHSVIKQYPLCLRNVLKVKQSITWKHRIKWICVRFFC